MKCHWWLAIWASLLALAGVDSVRAENNLLERSAWRSAEYPFGNAEYVAPAKSLPRIEESCECEPWRLFPNLGHGWSLTGWIDAGGTANTDSPASRYNGPMNFNDRNEMQFNQLYAVLERPLDTSGGWDWGGRIDVLWGTDYVFTQAVGLETHQDNLYLVNNSPHWNQNRFYGVALPQFYGEIGIGDVSAKFGHFYSPIGYEMVQATGNFFYSHAYTHRFGEPFTHTGALASYCWTENLSLVGGVVNGWDGFDRRVDAFGGLGGVTYTADSGRWSLAAFGISTPEPTAQPIFTPLNMYSLIYTANVSDSLQWVAQNDYAWQDNYFANGASARWYSFVNYLYYTFNDCWKAGLRAEWFRDDDGVRVNGVRPGNPNQAPFVGDFFEVTTGLNWSPTTNFRLRPEMRWDWFRGTGRPFDDGGRTFQMTAGLDAIFSW